MKTTLELAEPLFVKWVREQIVHYSPILGLDLQVIEIEKNETETKFLAMQNNYPYLDPMLYYHMNAVVAWNEGKLNRDRILHELCHCITDPFFEVAISRHSSKQEILDQRERLTDTIAAIIRKLDL